MSGIGTLLILLGGYFALCAKSAFQHDEPEAGALAGTSAAVFLLAGVKALLA